MTHITVQVPARVVVAPRGADFLAHAALAVFRLGHRGFLALLSGLRSPR